MLSARASRFHRETLTLRALDRWKQRHAGQLKINSLADELVQRNQVGIRQIIFDRWHWRASLLGRERRLVQSVEVNTAWHWWQIWRKQT